MLYTSYYSNPALKGLESAKYRLIRVTYGFPRFKLQYKLFGAIPALYPEREMKNLPWAEFAYHYREILEEETVPVIEASFQELSEGGKFCLVLLCFCKPGTNCHRHLFREWWLEKTGSVILELSEASQL